MVEEDTRDSAQVQQFWRYGSYFYCVWTLHSLSQQKQFGFLLSATISSSAGKRSF